MPSGCPEPVNPEVETVMPSRSNAAAAVVEISFMELQRILQFQIRIAAPMSDLFIGVKPVEERHRLDAARLQDFLQGRIDGFRGPLEIEQFKGGQSNPTYRLTAGGKRYALRKKPPGKLLPSAHAVDREYKVIKALHSVGFPVARPYVLCEDEAVIGT